MDKHPVGLKVLRLSRPVMKYSDGTSEPPVPLTTLALPTSFGNVYVGEQFSCMLSVNRDECDYQDIRVKIAVSMQLPQDLGHVPIVHDTKTEHILNKDQPSWHQTVHYEAKIPGLYILNITITYQVSDDADPVIFRKNYRFTATPAVSVKTKVTELPRGELATTKEGEDTCLIEARIENVSSSCLTLEAIDVLPSEGWELATSFDQQPSLVPQDVWQSLFVLKKLPLYSGNGHNNNFQSVGQSKLTLCWRRESLGEKGWLTTGNLISS